MGSWGYKPFQNDSALDWVGSKIETPILREIRSTLRYTQSKRSAKLSLGDGYLEQIAAAALLLEFSQLEGRVNLACMALRTRLYAKARRVIDAILKDERWVAEWSNPAKARAELNGLINSLSLAEKAQTRLEKGLNARIKMIFSKPRTANGARTKRRAYAGGKAA